MPFPVSSKRRLGYSTYSYKVSLSPPMNSKGLYFINILSSQAEIINPSPISSQATDSISRYSRQPVLSHAFLINF